MYVCMPKRDGNRAEVEAFFPVPMFSLTPDQGWHQTAAKPPESEPEVLLDSEVEARVLRLLRSTPELPSGVFALQTNKLLGLALISLPWSKADVLLLRLNSLFPSGAQPKSRSEKGCLIEELGGSNITAVGAVCACAYAHTHMPCAEHRVDSHLSRTLTRNYHKASRDAALCDSLGRILWRLSPYQRDVQVHGNKDFLPSTEEVSQAHMTTQNEGLSTTDTL